MEHSRDVSPAHCTFCDLIRGAAEVSVCHEDSDAIAFMDIQPVNNGHVLVVPREHYQSLLDGPEEIGLHLFKITMRLANAVRHVTGCNDMNIVVNSGAAAGQDEPHYHVHIIPRRHEDGFDIPLPFNGSEMPDRTVLDAYAAQIISALRDPMRGQPTVSAAHEHMIRRSAERTSDGPVYDETNEGESSAGVQQGSSPSDTNWEIGEGAHGEIVYDQHGDSSGTS